jgi:hypothetical protein
MALSWPFGAAMLRDLMLPWALGRSGSSPPVFAEPGVDSDSSSLSLGDLEEDGLPVAPPAPFWRGLFRFTLGAMGFNLEGTDDFVEMCQLVDRRYRSVVTKGPPEFVKAMFNTCSIQRPLYANLADLALKLERAVDSSAEACFQGVLHPFVFYFDVLRGFTEGFSYSHFRSLDWFSILLSPYMRTAIWSNEEFVTLSLDIVRGLVVSPAKLCDVDSRQLSAQFPAFPGVDGVPMPWEALLSGPRPAGQPDLWFYHPVLEEGDGGADAEAGTPMSGDDSS